MNTVIQVENLSKQYRLGKVGTGTISHDLNRWWHLVRGKEDPYLKIGEKNNRTTKGNSDYVWALKDINFRIEQGDAVGIIGKNGAGKSTLLKILSRTTTPTLGAIKLKGRIASLLEVGTGFHPELSGRENIYLNGAILGMTRSEIRNRFDEIVEFAGVERYIDTPVKRYSSGMYVRLAFAVAAHLESEILIIDEVLAVGDAEFQKRCLGKMGEISKEYGRTVLFVSHNMASITTLCNKGLMLEGGELVLEGDAKDTVRHYISNGQKSHYQRVINEGSEGFTLLNVAIGNSENFGGEVIERSSDIKIQFQYDNSTDKLGIYINVKFKDEEGRYFMVTTSDHLEQKLRKGKNTSALTIPANFFNEGSFSIDVMIIDKTPKGYNVLFSEKDILIFNIIPEKKPLGTWTGKEVGQIIPTFEWLI